MKFILFLFLFILIPFFDGDQAGNKTQGIFRRIDYNLTTPDKVYTLPASLHEISGITEVDGASVACVQDEHGIIFIYDLNKNQTTRQFMFAGEGDYEGIARVDQTLYVLRSDEALTEISNFKTDKFKRVSFDASLPGRDFEGLCYDKKNNRLLISPKEIPDNNPENKNKRFVYGFDLASKKLTKGPVFVFDISAIEGFAQANKVKIPGKGKKGEEQKPDIDMRISALGVHPLTNRLFAISSSDRLLFVFNMNGNIEYLERLDKDLFPQPEGITFLNNGDMLISNEGGQGQATLVRFNHKPKAAPKP
jgi:uncharacterized protein YjiK